MSTLMVIQCSGTKVGGGQALINNDSFEQQLSPVRNALINTNNIFFNDTELMQAYLRYGAFQDGNNGGRLYTHIDWVLALHLINQGHLRILIISALFGLLEYDTHIPMYDLEISRSKKLWKRNNLLSDTLHEYLIAHPTITNVQAFLSEGYFDVVKTEIPRENNCWIRSDRGAGVADRLINPFLQNL